ncbi:hypothetical protein MVEN_02616200 [Mycena venus]|uniref:Uncharacterized protein n=1 Tax=Mycena venus TaxID=2733690 RepID=A0A8H6U185_9AGAR|nr:hypothetical protein MVEN_02616200 [Mycena venus]
MGEREPPHIVDWITTIIATILAFLTTSMFSFGIRKCIALHLHDICPLAYSGARSRRRKLGLISIVIFILAGGVQTAGWKALITPYSIDAHGPLVGDEIDLSRPVASFIVGQTDSGYTAVKGDLGVPATFTMMDPDAGILPLTLESRNASTWFVNTTTIPTTLRSIANLPPGLSSWYSLTQRGFTADVSCNYWDPEDATVPPILISNTTVKDWNNVERLIDNITFSDLYSSCQVDEQVSQSNWSRAYTAYEQPNYLLMIACPSKDNYKLIFNTHPSGLYRFLSTTVCVLTPKITNVEVTYTNFINTMTNPIRNPR